MKNRLIAFFVFTALLCTSFVVPTFASGVTVTIDGVAVTFTEDSGIPFIDGAGRTQVPLRQTMEALGANVVWQNALQTVVLQKDGIEVCVPVGESYIYKNRVQIMMDTVAVIIKDRTYLPIRPVLEAFGATVDWYDGTQTVAITSPAPKADELSGEPVMIHGQERILTFYDEFDGTELDESKWSYRYDQRSPGAFWDKSATTLDGNGNLVLTVAPFPEKEGANYKMGAVASKGKFEQKYGYFEARIQLQNVPGFWGGFWLMADGVYKEDGSGRDGTEIDIVESPYLKDSAVNHALHWDGYDDNHKHKGEVYWQPGIYEDYHTFAMDWSEDKYRFYVDDVLTWETDAGGVCQEPLYMIISTEIGTWAGTLKENELPANILVDYVKVYK